MSQVILYTVSKPIYNKMSHKRTSIVHSSWLNNQNWLRKINYRMCQELNRNSLLGMLYRISFKHKSQFSKVKLKPRKIWLDKQIEAKDCDM